MYSFNSVLIPAAALLNWPNFWVVENFQPKNPTSEGLSDDMGHWELGQSNVRVKTECTFEIALTSCWKWMDARIFLVGKRCLIV